MSAHRIFCKKQQQDADGLAQPPFPGDLGEKIYENISQAAWQEWLSIQIMIINEYRLNLLDEEAQSFLQQEMQKFLFGSETPPDDPI